MLWCDISYENYAHCLHWELRWLSVFPGQHWELWWLSVFPGQHWELWWLSVSWSTLRIVVVVLCFLVNTENCDGCLCFLVIDTTSKEVADTPILLGLYFTVISPKFHDDCRWVSGPHKHLSVKIYQTRAIFNRVTTCCWVHCNNAK